ncbi:hypothetical protein [Streptomyces sp. NPDC053048]|uniref:hypothetical protein n=1 Tax=Streptomyces sp. NPDC053048 TaxID=3365694 RepID=UPI0037D651DC
MRALAWVLTTAAAMAVSWYGVRTVLAGTAYEPPRALPISGGAAPEIGEAASSTDPPEAPRSASPPAVTPPSATRTPDRSTPAPEAGAGAGESAEREAGASSGAGAVKSYPVRGGRAVFDLGESSAALVSATPDEGWRMRVWKQSAWIRVDFVAGTRTTSVFVTWNGHPPQVRTVES